MICITCMFITYCIIPINQTYKLITNKRLKEISNQIVIKGIKESHRKLFLPIKLFYHSFYIECVLSTENLT